MNTVSNLVRDLKPSGIRDFFDLVMGMDDVISLGVGEPDFVTPRHIRESAVQSLEEGYTNYTSNKGMPELRQAIANHLDSEHGLEYDPETEILVTTGVSEAMDLAMRATVNPDTGVLIPTPCYVSYQPTALLAGGQVEEIETRPEDEFRLDPDRLDDAASNGGRIMTINYPSNPTGVSYSRPELERIARVARERDLLVISDEIYGKLTFGREHIPMPTLPGMRERTLYLNGFSKAYAMTGFRIGYAAGPENLIAAMTKIHQYTMLCAPTTAQFAALEAIRHGGSAADSMKKEYERRRDLVVKRCREMGLPCVQPQGAFYAFPSIQPTGMDPEPFCRRLLESKKVAVVPGSAFGPGGETHVRMSFATDRERLREALDRLEDFLLEHQLMGKESGPGQKASSDSR